VNSPDAREVLVNEGHIAEALSLAARCDMGIVAIGAAGPNCPILHMANCNEQTIADLEARGAVGEIIGRFYDIEGRAVSYELNDRVVGLSLESIRALPFVVAVAGGTERAAAILGALRQRFVKVLIADFDSGTELAEASRADLRGPSELLSRGS
jgi:DNA-binding transcriptional regulator LsrR (DeoR family)